MLVDRAVISRCVCGFPVRNLRGYIVDRIVATHVPFGSILDRDEAVSGSPNVCYAPDSDRTKLLMNPEPTGSGTRTNTIGMVRVAYVRA
jgi:hypothetical protein